MNKRGPKSGFRKTITLRRKNRKQPTPAENFFWSKVRNKQFLGLKFKRQHGIGNYIVDFYCAEKNLVVEIDGDSHYIDSGMVLDKVRTHYLLSLGFKIVRYPNNEILHNIGGVMEDLKQSIEKL